MTERTHRAAHAAPPERVAGASLRGLQGGRVEGGREEGKNRDRRRVEQGRTRQRPRSQPLSYEYYRSLFLFGIRGRYVSPGVCVGCCLGEDTKLAVAPLTQSLFSRPRGRRPPRGRRRHAMAVGALVPPDAARVATRIATVYTNAPKRRRGAVFADLCTLLTVSTSVHNGATVYTNVPKRHREAVFADLCILLTVSTSDHATGQRYGSYDVDGPMAPRRQGGSDLRPTPPGR